MLLFSIVLNYIRWLMAGGLCAFISVPCKGVSAGVRVFSLTFYKSYYSPQLKRRHSKYMI